VISIESDILFPVKEQEFLATHIKGAEHTSIESPYGHDGFLLEFEQIEKAIKYFFHKQKNKSVFLSRLNESNSS
jgi:homoserine O-acetyltransferase